MSGCRGFFACILKSLNFLLTLAGLGMVGYGVYLLVEWMKISGGAEGPTGEFLRMGRPMLSVLAVSDGGILDHLPKAWFIYLFIGIGALVVIVSLFGCVGICLKNGCCLSCYAFLVFVLIVLEVGAAAFIFFDHSWQDVIPDDKTKTFNVMYDFLKGNWEIARWVAVGIVGFEVLLFLLALLVRVMYKPMEYDSDDEYIVQRTVRQPLVQPVPDTGVPVQPVDQRATRNDPWSQRMREKYGLDTAQFTYNPQDGGRSQRSAPPAEERGGCTIM